MGAGASTLPAQELKRLKDKNELSASVLKRLYAGFVRRELPNAVVVSDFCALLEVSTQPLLEIGIKSLPRTDLGPGNRHLGHAVSFEDFATMMFTLSPGADSKLKLKFLFDAYDRQKRRGGYLLKEDVAELLDVVLQHALSPENIEAMVENIVAHPDSAKLGLAIFQKPLLENAAAVCASRLDSTRLGHV